MRGKYTNYQKETTTIRRFKFQPHFAKAICQWVPDIETLRLIASEQAEKLTPGLLHLWVERSIEAYCLVKEGSVIAFATIGIREGEFPAGVCEINHLIVAPDLRRRGYCSILLSMVVDRIQEIGFSAAIGRVLPHNIPGLQLLKKQGWQKIHESWCDPQFIWFMRPYRMDYEQDSLRRDSYKITGKARALASRIN